MQIIRPQNNSYIGQMGSGRINAYNSIQCVNQQFLQTQSFITALLRMSAQAHSYVYDTATYNPDTWQWSFPGGSPQLK